MKMKDNYASPYLRFWGFILDWLIWSGFVLTVLFEVFGSSTLAQIYDSIFYAITVFLLWGLGLRIIQAFFVSRFGGSLGNLATGVKVVTEQGQNLTFWRAVFRGTVGHGVSAMFLCLGFIWVFIDEKNQGWHDQISENVVVGKPKVLLGTISLVLLLLINIYLANLSYGGFLRNRGFYKDVINDLKFNLEDFPGTPVPLPIERNVPIS